MFASPKRMTSHRPAQAGEKLVRPQTGKKLSTALRKLGFEQLKAADCVFMKGSGRLIFVLLVYVNDMIIMSESEAEVQNNKNSLKADFKITDLGPLEYFLGIKLERVGKTVMKLTQEKYTERVLERFDMLTSRPVDTPMAANYLSLAGSGPRDDTERTKATAIPYREALGCLLYIARRTRPDICFAVALLCRVAHDPHCIIGQR